MKRITLLLCALLILLTPVLSGCSSTENGDDLPIIVASNFPAYDFARSIAGDKANVIMLLPPGSEAHSYEPTPKDIIRISESELFIFTGGESDSWIDSILESLEQPIETLRMMDAVEALEEGHIEGMTLPEQPDEPDHDEEYDEHVWTSPINAMKIVAAISARLCEIDPSNADHYSQNLERYSSELLALDNSFRDLFNSVDNKTLIFGDRFPFLYFAQEYDLTCYAAFPGCSSESEPSAATIAFLTQMVKESKTSTIFYVELSNHLVADAIAEDTSAKTALLHSCHNLSKDELEADESYLTLMEKNLITLKEALG